MGVYSKFSFGGGGWGVLQIPTQTESAKICTKFSGRGRALLQTNIPEILSWRQSRNFEPKFPETGMSSASQIISHK